MSQQVTFNHDSAGEALTLDLQSSSGENIASGIAFAGVLPAGRYLATLASAVAAGWYVARVLDSVGILYTGHVKIDAVSGVYEIDNPVDLIATIDVGDITIEDVTVAAFSPSAMAQLAGKTIIVSAIALVNNQLNRPLIRGDAYDAAIGTELPLSNPNWPELPTGTTIQLRAFQKRTGLQFTFPGSVTMPTGAKAIRFEMTSAETMALKAGIYNFEVIATIPNAKPVHLVSPENTLRVLNGLT